LSEKGIRQMEQVAKYLNRSYKSYKTYNGLKAVYCSPLIRALKSAEIVADPHGLKPIEIPDLRERSFGIWEGMSFNEIKDKHPEEFEAWANNPLKYSPMGGESTVEVRDRAIKALEEILNGAAKTNTDIAIVAHGGVNRIILCHIMGMPLENIFRIEQDFAAVNIIEFHERYPVVKLLNYSGHL
jgi:alpha-ribazole phosphatase/probable phosphoglycerate mutase